MPRPIGIVVREQTAASGPAIVPAETTNVGFLLASQRGVLNKAIEITSLTAARLRYGAPVTGQYGLLALRGLFNNAAPFGARVFAVRVTGAGAVVATATLTSGDARFAARTGGPGVPANYTLTIANGSVAGKLVTIKDAAAGATVTELFDNIETPQQLADAVNRGLAGYNGGLASTLMTVSYVGGSLPSNIAETALGVDLLVDAPLTGAVDSIFKAGQLGNQDPGIWGNNLRITVTATPGAEYLRDISIYEVVNGEALLREQWNGVGPVITGDAPSSPPYFANVLNSPDNGSNYLTISTIGELPNAGVALTPLTTGADGAAPGLSDFQGVQSTGTGIYALDASNIQLVTLSDLSSVDAAKMLSDYAAARGDVLAIAAVDLGVSMSTISTAWTPKLMASKSYLTVYRSWLEVDNEAGGRVRIPPVGHVVGSGYVRKMLERSEYPHIAPAGLDTSLRDVLDLEFRGYNDLDLDTLVHTYGVNPIMYVPGRGFIIRTSRTMGSLSPNYSAHIRRSINFIRRSLLDNLSWIEQEANTEDTRRRVRDVLNIFFTTLYNAGMFETRGGFTNNVSVKCDIENNPMSVVDQRKMVVDVVLRFAEVAEQIEVRLAATRQGITIAEAA